MRAVETIPALPPADIRFRRSLSVPAAMAELWAFRELVLSLAERSLRARYKQAFLGFAWSLVQPLSLILVFSAVFRHAVRVNTEGVPYALYALLGLLPWSFFSASLSAGGTSLLSNISLLNKVYCPREVFPLSSVVVAVVDTMIATVALVAMFAFSGRLPRAEIYWAPLLLLLLVAFTYAATLLLAALVVYVRDLRNALPLFLQLGLFATPVAYGTDVIPEQVRVVYSAINPLAPVIEGLRRSVLYGLAPDWHVLAAGASTTLVLLVLALTVFKRLETGFADLV